jgi:methenyltetrahydromethanopterin cyclohydrolase
MDGAMTGGLGLNERAAALADAMAADAARLRIAVSTLDGGARLLDCGIAAPGGHEAGRLMAEVCLVGAGSVAFSPFELEGLRLPGVVARPITRARVPRLAVCRWAVKPRASPGSGPLRAIA